MPEKPYAYLYCNSIMFEYDKNLPEDLCMFNCEGKIDTLSSLVCAAVSSIHTGPLNGYLGFLYVNEIPIGYAIIDEDKDLNRVYYFDEEFIKLMKYLF
jgi:hypothetical protein